MVKADSVRELEGNTLPGNMARQVRLPRGRRARHAIQWLYSNPGDPAGSSKREYGKQPIKRKDAKRLAGSRIVCVVPVKSGNAGGGKAATCYHSGQGNICYTQG